MNHEKTMSSQYRDQLKTADMLRKIWCFIHINDFAEFIALCGDSDIY